MYIIIPKNGQRPDRSLRSASHFLEEVINIDYLYDIKTYSPLCAKVALASLGDKGAVKKYSILHLRLLRILSGSKKPGNFLYNVM